MPTYFGIATHRIIYKAEGFGLAKVVTAYIWSPALVKSAEQAFTEVSDGIYYKDYAFAALGTYFGIFYEGGIAKISGAFRIVDVAADVLTRHTPVVGIDMGLLLDRIYEMINNDMIVTEATGAVALRNIADDADIATGNVQDLGATTKRAHLTWVP